MRPRVTRFAMPLLAFALLLGVLIVGLEHAPEKNIIASPLIGKPAPTFSLPNLFDSQTPIASSSLKGRWVLVNVWGTWCQECRSEHPALLAIKQQGLVPILGIDWKDDDTEALSWLGQLGNPYEHVAADRDGRVAIDWGVYGAPETFLVNPDGLVVYKHVGALTPSVWHQEIEPRVASRTVPGSVRSLSGP